MKTMVVPLDQIYFGSCFMKKSQQNYGRFGSQTLQHGQVKFALAHCRSYVNISENDISIISSNSGILKFSKFYRNISINFLSWGLSWVWVPCAWEMCASGFLHLHQLFVPRSEFKSFKMLLSDYQWIEIIWWIPLFIKILTSRTFF